jgi:hypothetical protein
MMRRPGHAARMEKEKYVQSYGWENQKERDY